MISKQELIMSLGTPKQLQELEKKILEEKEKNKDLIKKEQEYARLVFSSKEKKIAKRKISFEQEMSYEYACNSFKEIRIERGNEIRNNVNPDFRWTFNEYDLTIIENLLRYFINDPTSKLSLHKGVWLFSKAGVGKSEFMNLFSIFCKKNKLSKSFDFINISEEYTKARNDKNCDNITKLSHGNKCFDEFLFQYGEVNSFGNKINLNEALIETRYIRSQNYCQLTHLTSNVTPNEALSEKLLNLRIIDRLNSMCNLVFWEGESKR